MAFNVSTCWKALKDHIDAINKLVATAAIFIAGYWTYSTFLEDHGHNLVVSVDVQQSAYDESRTLLSIEVTLKNIGKVQVRPDRRHEHEKQQDIKGEGCEITIDEYTIPEKPAEKLLVLDFEEKDGDPQTILPKYNLLASYQSFQEDNYVLNPGVEFHERMVVLVPKGKIYAVAAYFYTDGGSIGDIRYISTRQPEATVPASPSAAEKARQE